MSVFPLTENDINYSKNRPEARCFFGPPFAVARYDHVKYKQLDGWTEQQWSYVWQGKTTNLSKDKTDFPELSEGQQNVFTLNIKRQIVLDSEQGRAPVLAFLPICTLPELEAWLVTWTAFEQIHSRAYTHIIRNIYPNPSIVLDDIMNIKDIANCAKDISKYYDALIEENNYRDIQVDSSTKEEREYHHKYRLWMALNAVNALEGIRFYVSFACSWAFAELKLMEGNAKIIKEIARDENLHFGVTTHLIKLLPKEDADFAKLAIECVPEVRQMVQSVGDQEMDWADVLFIKGSMVGLNADALKQYAAWKTNKTAVAIGLDPIYPDAPKSNPLPWTEKWIRGDMAQDALQETTSTAYVTAALDQNITNDRFKAFKL